MAQLGNTKDLTGFKALSFDCYGTLTNWKPGIIAALQPILCRLPSDHRYVKSPQAAYIRFQAICFELEIEQPTLTKNHNLATGLRKLAAEAGVDERELSKADIDAMANGPGQWPAFPDSVEALETLKRRYKLIALSNIDNANIQRTATGPLSPGNGVSLFDAIYTAEDIGAYKPSHKNFEYLHRRAREELDVDVAKGELLHVAHGLRVDHIAAKQMGFPSCWIRRGTDRTKRSKEEEDHVDAVDDGEVRYQWEFEGMKEFVEEAERQFAAKQ